MTSAALKWIEEGTGPVLVLSHALGCDLGMWDGVAALLKDRYTVLRYDHRGHGLSPVMPGPQSLDDLADDVAGLIGQRSSGPVHFAGVSMGGMTAQALAARHPQLVRSITVANAANWYDDAARAMWQARVETVAAKGVSAISEGAMQRWFTPAFREAQPARVAELRKRLEAMDAPAYAASCNAVAHIDFRQSNATITCPALVIAGTRDEATPPAMSAAIAASIPGAQLQEIDAAHLSAVEQPEAFAAMLDRFIRSVG